MPHLDLSQCTNESLKKLAREQTIDAVVAVVDGIDTLTTDEKESFINCLRQRICMYCYRNYAINELPRCNCWNDR